MNLGNNEETVSCPFPRTLLFRGGFQRGQLTPDALVQRTQTKKKKKEKRKGNWDKKERENKGHLPRKGKRKRQRDNI
jgi:hypothetical protein